MLINFGSNPLQQVPLHHLLPVGFLHFQHVWVLAHPECPPLFILVQLTIIALSLPVGVLSWPLEKFIQVLTWILCPFLMWSLLTNSSLRLTILQGLTIVLLLAKSTKSRCMSLVDWCVKLLGMAMAASGTL